MNRCNELCTKETTGSCALCVALAERDRFVRIYLGGWLIESTSAFYRIVENSITIAALVFVLSTIFVVSITLVFFEYDRDFFKGILAEAHGMLFDILVIGIFILWLNKKGEKRLENKRYQEEIDDFRGWKSSEASHRIAGNIKRLNRNGVTDINLSRCYLVQADLWEANLRKAELWGADLRGALLGKADLRGAYIHESDLRGANLQEAELCGAQLWGTDLRGANLRGADLRKTDLEEADLREADLRGAKNLTRDQLDTAWGGENMKLSVDPPGLTPPPSCPK